MTNNLQETDTLIYLQYRKPIRLTEALLETIGNVTSDDFPISLSNDPSVAFLYCNNKFNGGQYLNNLKELFESLPDLVNFNTPNRIIELQNLITEINNSEILVFIIDKTKTDIYKPTNSLNENVEVSYKNILASDIVSFLRVRQ